METPNNPENAAGRIAVITDRQGAAFAVAHGADPQLLSQLTALSAEPPILAKTPRDAAERFTDPASIERWLGKAPKEIYFLTDADDPGAVRGVIWHGRASSHYRGRHYPYGFAIRIYEAAAGRGLAKPFMRACLRDLAGRQPEAAEGIWLETDTSNEAAQGLYASFGYEEVYRDKGRVHMVLSPERISEICSAGA